MSTHIAPRFPVETLRAIIGHLWRSDATTEERWALHATFAAAHPLLHEIFVSVAARVVYLTSHTEQELELCRRISDHAAAYVRARGEDPGVSSPPDHLEFDISWVIIVDRVEDREQRWATCIQNMLPSALHCTSLTVTSAHVVYRDFIRDLPELFPALTHLYLDLDDSWNDAGSDHYTPLPVFRALLFLRVKSFPPCFCQKAGRGLHDHDEDCLAPALAQTCPELRHLQIDTPFFLKLIEIPPTLDTLTIDAPPRVYILGRPPYSTIMGYNVSAALRRGSLRPPGRRRRTVVVQTGREDPYGYEFAREACAQYGIVLLKEVVY
ncbi:hypothetical protein C8Q76DRAFT_428183 [Earliella scabrosa]|nr:hypothetical protein C8Q76DRAFT_428183 [Earliella scabrosa]